MTKTELVSEAKRRITNYRATNKSEDEVIQFHMKALTAAAQE